MNSTEVTRACEEHKDLVNLYFQNDAKKLHNTIDKVLFKLKFDVDNSDFYSLGTEIFLDVLCRYDSKQDFNGFLYSSLYKKFCTEMTRRGRQKRQGDKNAVSINIPINDEDGNSTLEDMIADKSTVEKEIFEKKEDGYSDKMIKYLSKLSELQREVLRLISVGFTPSEIIKELHINQKAYEDCYNAIHSYRNTSILM